MGDNNSIILNTGDIVYNASSRDIGLLVKRFTNHAYDGAGTFEGWVWEVYWLRENLTCYTESGLVNMVECGLLTVYTNI